MTLRLMLEKLAADRGPRLIAYASRRAGGAIPLPMVMAVKDAGYDMRTKEGVEAWMARASVLGTQLLLALSHDPGRRAAADGAPPRPSLIRRSHREDRGRSTRQARHPAYRCSGNA
jgi:hypothetical protein